MRNFLIIVIGIIVLNAVLLYSGGFEYIKTVFEPEVQEVEIRPEVVDTFRQTLEGAVKKEIGTPIEGFEPFMLLEVFPGLAATDFDGVEASIGSYVLKNGRLEHQMENASLVHSAAKALPRRGYETLYRNVAKRIGVDIANGGTLTEVMAAIATE